MFDGAELPATGERQCVNHLALPVDSLEEFDAAYQRLEDHGVAVTDIIERDFRDPNEREKSKIVREKVLNSTGLTLD